MTLLGMYFFPYNSWLLYLFDILPCIISGMDFVESTGCE